MNGLGLSSGFLPQAKPIQHRFPRWGINTPTRTVLPQVGIVPTREVVPLHLSDAEQVADGLAAVGHALYSSNHSIKSSSFE